ncbi:MAG TPA: TetR/AcrR family transcriptional regulator [Geminicoccaceae bacterium]|nr:TetR/AcrR family transcriptional regulator [Geminicoccaceae bacterium]
MNDTAGREPRRRRRKEARPAEILGAALEEFAANGYAATRLDDVARRAGVSKGTIYLYFDDKEALFKEVVRRSVVPHLERLRAAVDGATGSAEAFLRNDFKGFALGLIESEARHVVRLLVAEGPRFPDLAGFYFDEVVGPGMAALGALVDRAVARGEFRRTALGELPQLLVAPALVALIWRALFDRRRPLDLDELFDTHVDLVLNGLKEGRP